MLVKVAKGLRDKYEKKHEALVHEYCGRVWREPQLDKGMSLLIEMVSRINPRMPKGDIFLDVGRVQERSMGIRFSEADIYQFNVYSSLLPEQSGLPGSPKAGGSGSSPKNSGKKKKAKKKNPKKGPAEKIPEGLIGGTYSPPPASYRNY